MKMFNILFILLGLSACTDSGFKESKGPRSLASYYGDSSSNNEVDTNSGWYQDLTAEHSRIGGTIEFPPGLEGQDLADLWHLTEGSDYYPLKWMYHLESQTTEMKGTMFLEKLDEKFGAVKDDHSYKYGYPLKWIGLTASWSNTDPRKADVRLENGQKDVEFIKWIDKQPRIAMAGVNCAFCHTSEVGYKGATENHVKKVLVEGAPSTLFIKGFFSDMMQSTLKTMLSPDKLAVFIDSNMGKPKGSSVEVAKQFSKNFMDDLGLSQGFKDRMIGKLYKKISPEGFKEKATKAVRLALYEKRDVTLKYITKLVELTHDLKGNAVPKEIIKRLTRMSVLIGDNPELPTTPEGYARTDAFGRIGNLVARLKNPTELTATVSVPHMWGIKYKSMFHWNANTNSVMNRNVGQSFGLGAVLTNQEGEGSAKYDATSNIHNLGKLEKLLYKIQVPNFMESFANHKRESREVLQKGCTTFVNTCMSCHQSGRRVGPTKKLVHDHVIDHKFINTDTWYSELQKAPVEGVPFKTALFSFVNAVKARYYERYDVSEEQQIRWQNKDLRGPELFRDTFLGESDHDKDGISSYVNLPKERAGYPARSLAGAWATAPYLHNGSIPNIRTLLTPENDRPNIFFVGSNEFDNENHGFRSDMDTLPGGRKLIEDMYRKAFSEKTIISKKNSNTYETSLKEFACNLYPSRCFSTKYKGNSNKGHSGKTFGTYLSKSEKDNLISFLKYVKPQIEYSWKTKPLYRINKDGNKKSCEIY
jgi:hypothetical protein